MIALGCISFAPRREEFVTGIAQKVLILKQTNKTPTHQ
jgi:hypothetical protein